MKRSFNTVVAAVLSLSLVTACGKTDSSSSSEKTAGVTNPSVSENVPEHSSGAEDTVGSSSDTAENSILSGEIDMSDEKQAMELEKKKLSVKADKDGFVIADNILYDYKGVEPEVHIPEGVTRIEAHAFWSNDVAEAVYIPSTVEYIGEAAFWSCPALRFVDIAEGVKKISDEAFWSCSGLADVNIPASVTYIGDSAFWSIPELTIHAPSGSVASKFNGMRGISHDTTPAEYVPLDISNIIAASQFAGKDFEEFIIPDNIISIEPEAFEHCEKLKSIMIPENVRYIAPNAFEYCRGLETVTINGCPDIKAEAFEYCEGMTTLFINEGTKNIGESAFAYCEKLKDVYLPESVESINEYAFSYCHDELTLHVPSGSYAEKYARAYDINFDNNV